jgi:hypothetical protein
MPEMVPAYDSEQSLGWNHFLRSGKSVLEHGTLADEVDILFGQRAPPQFFDKRPKPNSFPCRQYDAATSWNAGFKSGLVEKHLGKSLSNYQAKKAKHISYFGAGSH